jgi:hypothetical protein
MPKKYRQRDRRNAGFFNAELWRQAQRQPDANQPLKQSPSSVATAAFLFPVRSTLVAPGFLEP